MCLCWPVNQHLLSAPSVPRQPDSRQQNHMQTVPTWPSAHFSVRWSLGPGFSSSIVPGPHIVAHQQHVASYVFSSSLLQVFARPSPLRTMPTLFPRPTRAPLHTSPHLARLCLPPPPLHPIWGARRLRTGTALRRDPDQLCWLVSRAHLDTTERLTPIKTGQRPRAASPQNLTSSSARRHERPRKGGPDSTTDRGVVGSMLARVSSICRDKFTVLKFAHLVPEQPPRMSHG